MLQRLPIALAQVKAGNNSEDLLNETGQVGLFFVSIKINDLKSIQQHNQINPIIKMDTILMISENSKTSKLHVFILIH